MGCCRLCAAAVTESTSIFSYRHGNSIAEMVRFVSAVQIKENDLLTSLVCAECVELTVDAFQYVKRVREVNGTLRKCLLEVDQRTANYVAESLMESQPPSKVIETNVTALGVPHESEAPVSDPIQTMQTEAVEIISVQDNAQLDFDQISIEYLEDEPESASKKLISLLIESVNDLGSEKWCKIKQDPEYSDVLEEDGVMQTNDDDDDDEKDSSDDESFAYVEPKHVDYNPKFDGEQQMVRCCSRKCRLVFKSRDKLVEHGSEAHGRDRSIVNAKHPFECVICFQRFETRRNLLCHLRRLVRDYRCHFCNMYFDAPREKNHHMKSNHPNTTRIAPNYRLEDQPLKICCGCESTFETIEELYQHGADQHQSQPTFPDVDQGHQCNICYKFFKTKASLRNHQILVYKPKTYSCPTCGKAFECPSKLANHETTHTTERNFACSVCGGTYKTATDLRGHQRIHQEKHLVCNVCGARFHKKSHLRSHLKTHDDNAFEFPCSMCPRKFKEKSNWKSHLKVHTKEKPYKCEYCPKEFRYATDRKRHEMSHTGNYPHNCALCGKAFARGNQLQAHKRVCDKLREK